MCERGRKIAQLCAVINSGSSWRAVSSSLREYCILLCCKIPTKGSQPHAYQGFRAAKRPSLRVSLPAAVWEEVEIQVFKWAEGTSSLTDGNVLKLDYGDDCTVLYI